MKVFISVISHGHEELITTLGCLAALSGYESFDIVIKNNIPLKSDHLINLARSSNIYLLDEFHGLGFGENNNFVYNWCIENLNMSLDDRFLILNPDVLVDATSILNAVDRSVEKHHELVTINLYKDNEYQIFDNCVRNFPKLIDFFSSYVGLGNKTILDKRHISKEQKVDWAAGSFLLFKSSLYRDLGGFDPKYFMYCEDIDICWRAQKLLVKSLVFYPDIKAIHYAEHANRSLFSKHFLWHVKSMFRYLLISYCIIKPFQSKRT